MNRLAQKLTQKQEIAALSLSMGSRIAEAAGTAGVKPRTVKLWLADVPAFRKAIDSFRAEATQRALGIIADAAAAAALKIVSVMKNSQSERVQLKAAGMLLDKLLRMTELINHEQRLQDIEAQLDNKPRIAGRTG